MGERRGRWLALEDPGRRRALKSFCAAALSPVAGCAGQMHVERDAHPRPERAYLAGVYLVNNSDTPIIGEIQYAGVGTAESYSFRFRPTRYLQLQEVVPGSYRVGGWTMHGYSEAKQFELPGHAFSRVFRTAAGRVTFAGEYSLVLSSRRDAAGIYYGGRVEQERVDVRFHDREMMKGLFPNFAALPLVEAYGSQ